jgi:hypothetical protein
MRRKAASAMDGPGQDSFLDIVANLIGILIILVMVIGVRAKDAILEAAHVADRVPESPAPDVEGAAAAASAVEADIFAIDAKIKWQEFNIEYRRSERDRVHLLVQAAEEELADRRSHLDEAQRNQFDVRKDIAASESELSKLVNQVASLKSAAAPVAVIDHLPTPMARTVFGRELHLSLSRGRLRVIPWDQLVAQLKSDAPRRVQRLKDRDEITETLGPVGGFWMKYTLVRKRRTVTTRVGVAVQQGVELDHFVLVPVAEDLGEDLTTALADGSEFRAVLDQHQPETTTLTVWTYPDSFNEFRTLKQSLYARGYLLASRPLPEGFPIGGSPSGMRSSAQ